jgi:hypothetical protein
MQDPELLLTDPAGFALVNATPLQRAIAWLVGTGSVPLRFWEDADVRVAFGDVRPTGETLIDEFGIVAGIRGGKTLMAAMAVAWATQHVDLDTGPGANMVRGEVPRVSIVSVSKDQADTAFGYLRGAFEGSPALRPLLIGDPTADTIMVRHPSGRPIEICVVAGSKAGSSLVGRWCAGVIFDEAPLMALDEGLVRLSEMATNVRPRMLAGARIMYIGSPWGNSGFIYDLFNQNFGKPNPTCTWVRARGWMLNPVAWTEENQARLKAKDERSYRLNCLAEFMDPESAMYASVSVDKAMARTELIRPPEPGKVYTAAIDPGFSSNSWTFVVAETEDNVRFDVVFATQWTGSGEAPLKAGDVFDEMLPTLVEYGCTGSVKTDQYAAPPLVEIALTKGIGLSPLTITKANKFKLYASVGVRLDSGYLSLPPIPEMRADLLNVKKRVTGDGIKAVLPETADGRHCDYAAALALLIGDYLESSQEMKAGTPVQILDDDDVDESQVNWFDDEPLDNRDYDDVG